MTDATPVLVHYIDGSEMGSLSFFPLLRWWVGASVIKSERIRLLADSPPPSSIHLTMEMHGEKERESLDRCVSTRCCGRTSAGAVHHGGCWIVAKAAAPKDEKKVGDPEMNCETRPSSVADIFPCVDRHKSGSRAAIG